MTDLVVGSITRYDYAAIAPWVNSLNRSGFSGTKAMLCYDIGNDVINKLKSEGFDVWALNRDDKGTFYTPSHDGHNIVVDRFHEWASILRTQYKDHRYVVMTDVKDVVFQTNPTDFLDYYHCLRPQLITSCEGILYRDEEWGRHNIAASFGKHQLDVVGGKYIVNAGVIAGRVDMIFRLSNMIRQMCDAAHSHHIAGGGGPDQAAYNLLVDLIDAAGGRVLRTRHEHHWAAQLGTMGPQIAAQYGDMRDPHCPIMIDGLVCNPAGKPYTIVHQYDRVPGWREEILKRYA